MIEKNCTSCVYAKETDTGEHCNVCGRNYTDKFKPMTNADRIRNMTDDELAKELLKCNLDDAIPFCKHLKKCDDILSKNNEIPEFMCEKCLLEWLQAECEDEVSLSEGVDINS